MYKESLKKPARGLCSANKVAEILSIHSRTVHYWADAGKIPVAIRACGIIRFNLDDVMAALESATAVAQQRKVERSKAAKKARLAKTTVNN